MITLNNVTLRRGAKVLLNGASATIHPGEKVALVGRNGTGKSTLFALLSGVLHEDGGDFHLPAGWRIAQVSQHMPETQEAATAFVLAGDTRLTQLQTALAQAEQTGDGMAIAQAHSDLQDAGAHDATARAQALILGLGFKPHELQRPVTSFSGGWRMRLQLARALMAPSDLLLLDEPTNHLDLDALVWLEGWLARYTGTLIVISHDRDFLDAATQVTLHIEQQHLKRYGGNYSAFEELRAQQLALQQAAYQRQQEKRAHLQKFIDRFKAKATKARQAQSRVKALERMEKIAPVLAEADFEFSFAQPPSLPNPMLAIHQADFGYRPHPRQDSQPESSNPHSDEHSAGHTGAKNENPTVILRGVNRTVLAGQRIGILGANGQGKSTFVKTIAHELPLLAGHVTEGKGLSIGYFAQQELDVLHPHSSPLEHMVRLARQTGRDNTETAREQQLRNFLGGFNFAGDMAAQPVGQFSGGEKARLVLAMLVWQRPNLLLLDEPTNHLDLTTREALALALNSFEGTLMLVSHDRALLRSVCDEFWLVARGNVTPFDGDLHDYQRYLMDEARRQRETASAASTVTTTNAIAASSTGMPDLPDGKGNNAPGSPNSSGKSNAQHHANASAGHTTGSASTAPPSNPAEQRRQQAQRRAQLAEKTKPLKRQQADTDARMTAIAQRRSALEAQLAQPGATPAAIASAGRELKSLADELTMLEEQWLELVTQIDALEQDASS